MSSSKKIDLLGPLRKHQEMAGYVFCFSFIFYAGKTHNRPSRGPLKNPRHVADYVFCQHPKNNIINFSNQQYIGNFKSLCDQVPMNCV
jgi:hypothetical protein